jgi:single-strand DNA-binding protein
VARWQHGQPKRRSRSSAGTRCCWWGVSGAPEERELPSGDLLVCWRVVLDRPASHRRARKGVRPVTVDAVDCVAWGAGVRRTARSLSAGDVVAVEGALRRRFWRGDGGASSRTEVEVDAVRRLRRGDG